MAKEPTEGSTAQSNLEAEFSIASGPRVNNSSRLRRARVALTPNVAEGIQAPPILSSEEGESNRARRCSVRDDPLDRISLACWDVLIEPRLRDGVEGGVRVHSLAADGAAGGGQDYCSPCGEMHGLDCWGATHLGFASWFDWRARYYKGGINGMDDATRARGDENPSRARGQPCWAIVYLSPDIVGTSHRKLLQTGSKPQAGLAEG